jgi:hypothetical protein
VIILNKIYTGIGARKVPDKLKTQINYIGWFLAEQKYTLRSGAANGCDKAFEEGCDKFGGKKEIYLPWFKFNDSESNLYNISEEAYEVAAHYHPNWNACTNASKKFLGRDVYQVLGLDLKTETNFIVCYTPDGKLVGGTSQALRIANDKGIKIFNIGQVIHDNSDANIQQEFIRFYANFN